MCMRSLPTLVYHHEVFATADQLLTNMALPICLTLFQEDSTNFRALRSPSFWKIHDILNHLFDVYFWPRAPLSPQLSLSFLPEQSSHLQCSSRRERPCLIRTWNHRSRRLDLICAAPRRLTQETRLSFSFCWISFSVLV